MEVLIPDAVKDFIFDLSNATCRSMFLSEIESLYDSKFREVSDKFFAVSSWPEPAHIANECGKNEVFLLFYRELTLRHVFTRLKPSVTDYVESWNNYSKLFSICCKQGSQLGMTISSQWAYDVLSEFVYQYQGFNQFRNTHNSTEADVRALEAAKGVWSIAVVRSSLTDIVKACESATKANGNPSAIQLLGYFALIELARLECLSCNFADSLSYSARVFEHNSLTVKSSSSACGSSIGAPLYTSSPLCHINVFYHASVSQLAIGKFAEALKNLNEIVLHVSQRLLRQGSVVSGNTPGTVGLHVQLQKNLDRLLGLSAIGFALCPQDSLEVCPETNSTYEFVYDLVSKHLEEKFDHLIQLGDSALPLFSQLFEQNSPKFVTTGDVREVTNQFNKVVSERVSILKLRGVLTLYSSVTLDKLAKIDGSSVDAVKAKLSKFKTSENIYDLLRIKLKIEGNTATLLPVACGKSGNYYQKVFERASTSGLDIVKGLNESCVQYNL